MEKENYFAPYDLQFDEKERKIMLGEMLKALRQKRNLTQKEVAQLLDINQASYAQYEKGENAPSVEKLVRLSFIFKCPTDILLQRNVFFHGKEAMLNALNGWESDMKEAEKKMTGTDDPNIMNAVKGMQTLISQIKDMLNNQK